MTIDQAIECARASHWISDAVRGDGFDQMRNAARVLADEVERLQSENARLRAPDKGDLWWQELMAENERLKKALENSQ